MISAGRRTCSARAAIGMPALFGRMRLRPPLGPDARMLVWAVVAGALAPVVPCHAPDPAEPARP